MEDNVKKVQFKVQLNNMQRAVNKEFEENGLTDEVLEKQLQINSLRNKYDFVDETEKVYEEFTQ